MGSEGVGGGGVGVGIRTILSVTYTATGRR